ncbi:MAG: DUF6198 family protein [Ruminococcus sp.]
MKEHNIKGNCSKTVGQKRFENINSSSRNGCRGSRLFYTEIGYLAGLVLSAVGVAFMIRANLGVSMIVAPSLLIQQKLAEVIPWITIGQVEGMFQAVLLLLMTIIIRRFRVSYLFSVVTVFIYSLMLDTASLPINLIPNHNLALQIVLYILGWVLLATGLSFMFRTYIAPEVYELFVKEVTERYNLRLSVVKTVYDMSSLALAIILSFVLFGCFRFDIIFVGTVVNALFNGMLIGRITKFFDRHFEFIDRFPMFR